MKRSLLTVGVVAAMLLTASAAFADEAILQWTNCLGDGGVSNLTFGCTSNAGNRSLVAAVKLTSDMTQVLSDEVVIDLIASTPSALPDWWQLRDNVQESFTACRNGALSIASQDGASCPDIFSLQGSMNIAAYQHDRANNPVPGLTGTARILSVNAVPSTSPVDLILADNPAGNGTWAIGKWTIGSAKTVGAPSCAGCLTPVCIVLNSVNITVVGNTNNRLVSGGVDNTVTWQGAGADCNAVPTKNKTWGAVKSLYR
jgi:hypothetical protein